MIRVSEKRAFPVNILWTTATINTTEEALLIGQQNHFVNFTHTSVQ